MALNLKSSLEIVKRAGFGPDDRMKADSPQRHMADSQRVFEPEPLSDTDALDEALERIDYHRNPQNMTHDQLLDIDDL